MKKMLFLLAFLCASQSYGMNEPKTEQPFYGLPKELRERIFNTAMASSKTMKEVINVIQASSALYGIHYDRSTIIDLLAKQLPDYINGAVYEIETLQGTSLQDFTALMDVLAKKFPNTPRKEIAKLFDTQIAKQYINLGEQFQRVLNSNVPPINKAQDLIAKGVDPNFTWGNQDGSLLGDAISRAYDEMTSYTGAKLFNINPKRDKLIAIVKLLLDNGARPNTWLTGQMKFIKKQIIEQRLEENMRLYNLIEPYTK